MDGWIGGWVDEATLLGRGTSNYVAEFQNLLKLIQIS